MFVYPSPILPSVTLAVLFARCPAIGTHVAKRWKGVALARRLLDCGAFAGRAFAADGRPGEPYAGLKDEREIRSG